MMNTTHRSLSSPVSNKVDLAPLEWHEDLDAALASARTRALPVLSLRLLGRLDEELSCANSRFFRTMLYPDPRVAHVLSTQFVLHWRSVRPVPVVTIDFGDGRSLVRTLTGNSAHLVLDQRGRPVDALPGMYGAQGFLTALAWARALAVDTAHLEGRARSRALAQAHTRALIAPRPRAPAVQPFAPEVERAISRKRPDRPDAREAGQLAIGKMMVERPLLDRIDDLATTVHDDEAHNETALHPQVHERFARSVVGVVDDERSLTTWLYEQVFLMPDDDPWLGLVSGFAALPDDGRRTVGRATERDGVDVDTRARSLVG